MDVDYFKINGFFGMNITTVIAWTLQPGTLRAPQSYSTARQKVPKQT